MQASFYLRRLVLFLLSFLVAVTTGFTALFFWVTTPPEPPEELAETTETDASRLTLMTAGHVQHPASLTEIRSCIARHHGPIAVGSPRKKASSRTLPENTLFIGTHCLNGIVSFSPEKREIVVQTGTTWRQVQEYIDPYNLSVKIMQTYANFTVGGSLNINAHGRYMGRGPLVSSVKAIKVVLADGSLVTASPTENPALFYGCIGGYGALGIIVEATLGLSPNCKVERRSQRMSLTDYVAYFRDSLRSDSLVIFHHATLYPNEFDEIRTVSYRKTQKAVTVKDRLKPLDGNYRAERFAMWMVSEAPFGKWIRRHWGDPYYYETEQVKWRNYEASFDANELEAASRKNATYVVQEYFVPTNQLITFVPRMADVFRKHEVNVLNVSIRHAQQDPGTLLAWARTEVFSLVVYYKRGTRENDRQTVSTWTREIIDEALACGGSYYLPYQVHATPEQFQKAYPKADEFFALKERLDPTGKFTNKVWDCYYSPGTQHLAGRGAKGKK